MLLGDIYNFSWKNMLEASVSSFQTDDCLFQLIIFGFRISPLKKRSIYMGRSFPNVIYSDILNHQKELDCSEY